MYSTVHTKCNSTQGRCMIVIVSCDIGPPHPPPPPVYRVVHTEVWVSLLTTLHPSQLHLKKFRKFPCCQRRSWFIFVRLLNPGGGALRGREGGKNVSERLDRSRWMVVTKKEVRHSYNQQPIYGTCPFVSLFFFFWDRVDVSTPCTLHYFYLPSLL